MSSFTALSRIGSGSRMVGPDRNSMPRLGQFKYQGSMYPSDPIIKALDNTSNKVEKTECSFSISMFSKGSSK